MAQQQFCVQWKSHKSRLLSDLSQFLKVHKVQRRIICFHQSYTFYVLQVETFSDVTLAGGGASQECHKIVLAACPPYFRKLLLENTCKHPVLFLEVPFFYI